MGARSLYHIGCFINVIKHGRALWPCIIADLQRRRREGGLTGKGGWRGSRIEREFAGESGGITRT